MTHVMLDLETWGKTPGSDIRSIGAVVFDPTAPYGGFVGMRCTSCINGASDPWGCTDCLNTGTDSRGEFYVACENSSVIEPGVFSYYPDGVGGYRKYPLARDPETVKWWSEQTPEAQAAFEHPVDLRKACGQFQTWFCEFENGNMQSSKTFIWANGPQFDISILKAVFDAVGLDEPWYYRAPRDFRTITDAAGMTRDDFQAFNHGTTHNALDDAISQAKIVCEAYKRLGLQK
ncbi:putative exodeoxyribonuclease [Rhizobium phage vB_RglS_P106B]|uniref:Putative exodeoxyribonuclease n=1 Tax=Rhizobium phage vB_RglS_P106B TaxID=1458697 RepID=W6E9Q9_9CAUD|nr:exonuclease [Rhizobium phage vB_RglS_P106B]AHJ10733.1 putative exodeoxyribonuclease [Rhizobium phage vB_RglS_P106B]